MCVYLWNACLPFLTAHLRSKVHAALRTIATTLSYLSNQSLPMLRSQVHYEVALCEEQADFAGIALQEVTIALQQDYGELQHPVPAIGATAVEELLDLNRLRDRLRDQYLKPFHANLTMLADVYANPTQASHLAPRGDQAVGAHLNRQPAQHWRWLPAAGDVCLPLERLSAVPHRPSAQ
jgi:hypothetical protein